MAIEKYLDNPLVIFNPIIAYKDSWSLNANNLVLNSKVENNKNLFKEYLDKTYYKDMESIFFVKELDFDIGLISIYDGTKRVLKYSKVHFLVSLANFLCESIDTYKMSEEEVQQRLKELLKNLNKSTNEMSEVILPALDEKIRRLNDLKEKEINSDYFDASMKDYLLYKDEMDYSTYIEGLLYKTNSLKKGFLNIDDLFSKELDYNEIIKCFNLDKLYLLFAKVIFEHIMLKLVKTKTLSNAYQYIFYYKSALDKVLEEDKTYSEMVYYTLRNGRVIRYSLYDFMYDYNTLITYRPELKNYKVSTDDDRLIAIFKDLSKEEKITKFREVDLINWTKDTTIPKNNYLNLLFTLSKGENLFKGKNEFNDYYAFLYENGTIIVDNNLKDIPAYIMDIDTFILLNASNNIKEFINNNKSIKRVFHTNIDNYKRNILNNIEEYYKLNDALEFINTFDKNITLNKDIYSTLKDNISKNYKFLDILLSEDNKENLNIDLDSIISYLEFSLSNKCMLGKSITNKIIITEGDIVTILKILNDLFYLEGEYTIYINNDNLGILSYLKEISNNIYKLFNKNVIIKLDYNKNYNSYINSSVTLIGSSTFVSEVSKDFSNRVDIIV